MKQELQLKREERKLDRQGDTRQSQSQEADMTVEVMGKVLPEVSLEDEIRVRLLIDAVLVDHLCIMCAIYVYT